MAARRHAADRDIPGLPVPDRAGAAGPRDRSRRDADAEQRARQQGSGRWLLDDRAGDARQCDRGCRRARRPGSALYSRAGVGADVRARSGRASRLRRQRRRADELPAIPAASAARRGRDRCAACAGLAGAARSAELCAPSSPACESVDRQPGRMTTAPACASALPALAAATTWRCGCSTALSPTRMRLSGRAESRLGFGEGEAIVTLTALPRRPHATSLSIRRRGRRQDRRLRPAHA